MRWDAGSTLAIAIVAVMLGGCTSESVRTVEAFRAARAEGDLDRARASLSADPRVWYEAREGEGQPWRLGEGRWATWDEHFRSEGDVGPWNVDPGAVWAIVEERNDYFRLIERRDVSRYRRTYFIDDDGRIAGTMISPAFPDRPSPARESRFDEIEAWALAHEPEEWAYLRPGGSIDPTGDRAGRTRALINRWRVTVGLEPIE